MRRLLLCYYLLFVALLFFSCTKMEKEEISFYNTETIRDSLVIANNKDKSIKDIKLDNGGVIVVFPDNVSWRISGSCGLLSLGIDGFWYIDNERSVYSLDDYSESTIMELLKDSYLHDPISDCLWGIAEDYTGWTFYFQNSSPISFVKSIYSYDADAIMRSVNHRGFSAEAPENTLPAYRLSRLKGFKYVETDIRFTLDGIPVLLHDATVDRTSNGNGEVSQMTFDEIKRLDFGSWKSNKFEGTEIPSLEEFLSLCAKLNLEPNIELKVGSQEQIYSIVSLVEEYGLTGKVTYISFYLNLLRYVLDKVPDARIGFLANRVTEQTISYAQSIKTEFNDVYIGASDYGDSAISLCQSAGIPLSVWVIDSEKTILSLPKYISGVSSNRLHAGQVIHDHS